MFLEQQNKHIRMIFEGSRDTEDWCRLKPIEAALKLSFGP